MRCQWQTWPELFGIQPTAATTSYVISYLMYVISALMFALLAAVLVRLFAPYACGSGISEVTHLHYCPAICSIVRILSLLFIYVLFMYGYGFLSRSFTNRRKILRGGSARSRTGFLPFWRDSPRVGRVLGINRGPYGGICFLLKHLLLHHCLFSHLTLSVTDLWSFLSDADDIVWLHVFEMYLFTDSFVMCKLCNLCHGYVSLT